MKLKIFVGTVTETALTVAQAVQELVSASFEHIDLVIADDNTTGQVLEMQPDERALFCISTYHSGDLPDNIQALYFDLDFKPRYLGAMHYGLIALGDSGFGETFAGGGRQFDARLQDLGANRIHETLVLDACDSAAENQAKVDQWTGQWLNAALKAA